MPVRCAGAAQLLVEHAQLLVGMPIRVFSLWTVCVLSSRLFRGHGDVLHSRQRCPLIPLTGVSTLVPRKRGRRLPNLGPDAPETKEQTNVR